MVILKIDKLAGAVLAGGPYTACYQCTCRVTHIDSRNLCEIFFFKSRRNSCLPYLSYVHHMSVRPLLQPSWNMQKILQFLNLIFNCSATRWRAYINFKKFVYDSIQHFIPSLNSWWSIYHHEDDRHVFRRVLQGINYLADS